MSNVDLFFQEHERLFSPFFYGFEFQDGWNGCVLKCLNSIAEYVALHPDSQFRIEQLKQKFGGLRFYYIAAEKHYDEIHKLVILAEKECSVTCELCGQPGRLCSSNGWLMTMCGDCAAENGYKVVKQ
jgi:hypothetical protein